MSETTSPAPTGCVDGLVMVPGLDGELEPSACLGKCCESRRQVNARIARTGDVFLGAGAPADEEW